MKRQAGWIAAEAAVAMVGAVVTTFLVSRLIGPAEVGRAALAAALVMLAQPFVGFCFTSAMVQRAQLAAADVASVLWASLGTALLLGLPLASLGLLAPDLLGPGTGPVLAVLVLVLLFSAIEGPANGVVLRAQDFRILAIRGICASLAGLAAGLSLALAGAGAWAVVGQQLAFFGTSALIVAVHARLWPRLVLDRGSIRQMLPFAVSAGLTGLAGRIGFRTFLVVVAGGMPALAGILQIAFRIVEVAREVPSPFIHRYGLPALSRLREDRAAFLRRLEALCRLSALVFAPAFIGLAFCAPEVQRLLLGPAWVEIVVPVQVLSVALALAAFGFPLSMAFVADGRPTVSLWLTLGGLVLVLALALMVPHGSSHGAALAWAAMLGVEVLAASLLAARLLGFAPARQLRAWLVTLLPAVAVGAVLLQAQATGLLPAYSLPLLLLAKVGLGAAVGAPLIILLGHADWREVARPVREEATGPRRQPSVNPPGGRTASITG